MVCAGTERHWQRRPDEQFESTGPMARPQRPGGHIGGVDGRSPQQLRDARTRTRCRDIRLAGLDSLANSWDSPASAATCIAVASTQPILGLRTNHRLLTRYPTRAIICQSDALGESA